MVKSFKLFSSIKSVEEDGDLVKIAGYASTSDTDRVGDVIIPEAWTKGGLDNYSKNPILLLNHNYNMPIGKATRVDVDAKGLRVEAVISKSAEPAYGLIKDGVLTTFSVGFGIKDADYNSVTDGYIIKEAELLEISVVSVPCNQDATFSLSKSFDSAEERAQFNKEVNALKGQTEETPEANASEPQVSPKSGTEEPGAVEKTVMNPEEIAALAAEAAVKALDARVAAEKAAAEKAAAEKAAADAAALNTAEVAKKAAEVASQTTAEKLLADFEARLKANEEDAAKTFNEMKGELEAKSAELRAMHESKRFFGEKSSADPLVQFAQDAEDTFLMAKALRKPIESTKLYARTMEKFNTHSTVTVGTDRLETTVSTNIERDIWNALILAPMFREIQMHSAQMSFPIMPDAGYAEITAATAASGTQPNGNVDPRGAAYGAPYSGITLTEKLFSTVKMISKSYLGNETEEDAILPILPLIKESMVRSHARGVENLILAGNSNQGVYTSGAANGLLKFAETSGRTVTASAAGTPALAAKDLFGLRKAMGKYGRDPRDVIYIVSQDAWFSLAEDPEFLDADLVGANNAVKLTGSVGRIYGSDVVVCDEFAPAGAGNYFALALNTRNFVIPRLRGMTVESEYQTEQQRTCLVTSQRLGFDEIIPNAPSVIGLRYQP